MANTGGNLENRGDQLNEAQLRALEGISPDTPENQVLDKAKEIGLISDDTVKSIQAALPNHALLFQRALARERREAGTRTDTDTSIAFKRAFENVYGRFLLDQGPKMVKDAEGNSVIAEGEMEHQDHPFMKMLEKVLKVKVSPEFGLKGRSELQAVVRRLREYTNNRRPEANEERKKIPKLEKENENVSKKRKVAERYLGDLKGVSEIADSIYRDADEYVERNLNPLLKELKELETVITDLESRLNSAEASISVEGVSPLELINFFSRDPEKVLLLSENQLNSLYKKIQSDQCFARKLFGIDASAVLDKGSVKTAQRSLQQIFHPDRFSGSKYNDDDRKKMTVMSQIVNEAKMALDKAIDGGDIAPIDDLFAKRDSILSELAVKRAKENTLKADLKVKEKENTDKVLSSLDSFSYGIDSLRNDRDVTTKVKDICDNYTRKYKSLLSSTAINDPTTLKNFLKNEMLPLVAKLRDALIADVKSFDNDLEGLQIKIDNLNSFGGIESILERAFGKQKTSDEMAALGLKSQEAESKKKAIQEGYDLITGEDFKAPKDVHAKFKALKKVTDKGTLTAKSLREADALDAKMKEHKDELGKIKDLFADGETAALNDSFLKLGEFREAYDESRKDIVIEAEGPTKFDKALSILSGQLASYKEKYSKEPVRKYAGAEKTEAETKVFELGPKVEYLKELKDKREKYKEKAEAVIKKLREYLIKCNKAFELGLAEVPGTFDKAAVASNREKLDKINVSTGVSIDDLQEVYSFLKSNFGTVLKYATEEHKSHEFGVKEAKGAKDKKENLEKAKALHEALKPLVDKVKKAADLGVDIKFKDPSKTAAYMKKEFDELKPEDAYFDAAVLVKFYEEYFDQLFDTQDNRKAFVQRFAENLTGLEKEAKAANKELTLAKEAAEKSKDLTDPQAALKIVGVLVAEQFPKLSMTEQEKLAKLILAGDVAKLQTEEGYDALAKRGSAEDLNLENLHALAVRGKLIGFKYQEGDKEVQPFKGMKPENFEDWASIEKLFNLGQLNHKNGFFLMAALEIFDEEKGKIPGQGEEAGLGVIRSIQSLRVEDKLKFLLAKQLGVHERMHVAGVNKIINDAFKEQMEKVRPLVKAHFSTYENEWDKGGKGVKSHKIQLLNLKYEELNDKLRKGEIDHAVYEIKLKALVKEATDADVMEAVGFSEKSMLSGFWHSKYSQWVRDRGHDVGKYVGKKALRFGWGSVKGGALGSLNAAGWLGLRGTSLGVGLAKWPTAILTGIGSGIFSIFRRGKWMDNVKKDVGNVMSTAGGWQDAMKGKAKGVKILSPIGKQIAGEWGKSKYEGTKYADRVKKKEDRRAEKLKVLEEKAKLKAVEIASSPFIDLAQYKAKIEELDKILGTTTKFPAEGNVKVGHEEKAAVNADKKDDHGHQPPAAAAHH